MIDPSPAIPARKEVAPPSLTSFPARAQAVLLAPVQAFRQHDVAWGWWQPWLLVALCGVLAGAASLARVDHEAWQTHQWERVLDRMPSAQRKQMEEPKVAENMAKFRRFQVFLTKIGKLLGPPLFGLVGLVFAAALFFLIARFFAPEPADLAACVSIAAWVSLANVVAYVGEGWGALLGNPEPATSLAVFVDPITQPVQAALLGRADVALLLYYLLFVAALHGALRLSKARALAFGVVAFGLSTAGAAALASLSLMGANMKGGS